MKIPYTSEGSIQGPTRSNDADAGNDLRANKATMLSPGERQLIGTGITVAIPLGFYGLIAPRSGLAVKNGIDVLGGIVDSGYSGEIMVCLINHGQTMFRVQPGDRIAQLIIQPCASVEWEQVSVLPETKRGAAGFGSTGK